MCCLSFAYGRDLMHDIWNPWHGCVKCSEGCQHCYMYFLDGMRNRSGADIYRTKAGFRYPLQKNRNGSYKVQSGELIRVCMTSDFFLEEADGWREEFVMEGTHEGEWIGIKPTHKRLSFTGVDIDKVIDGKIVEHGGAVNTFETLYEQHMIKPV